MPNSFQRTVKTALSSAVLLIIAGCTTPRVYPICNYNSEAGGVSTSEDDVSTFIRGVAGEKTEIQYSPNYRYVIIKTTNHSHEMLRKVWPSAACIGKSRYDVEYLKFKGCVYMIKKALDNDGIAPLGGDSDSLKPDSTFYCGTPLSINSKTN